MCYSRLFDDAEYILKLKNVSAIHAKFLARITENVYTA